MNFDLIKQKTYQTKITYLTLTVMAFMALIYFTLYQPTIEDINDLRKTIIDIKIKNESKINNDQEMLKLSDEIKKIESNLPHLDNAFAKSTQKLEFITTLEGIAKNNNINQTIDLKIDKIDNKKSFQTIPLQINAQGNFQQLIKYLQDIETLSFYININSIDLGLNYLDASGGLGSPSLITKDATLTISADTFWK